MTANYYYYYYRLGLTTGKRYTIHEWDFKVVLNRVMVRKIIPYNLVYNICTFFGTFTSRCTIHTANLLTIIDYDIPSSGKLVLGGRRGGGSRGGSRVGTSGRSLRVGCVGSW